MKSQLRIILLALDGEPSRAEKILHERYPLADIEILPRVEIERAGARARLRALRSLSPDVFAVSTERLAWQQGQNALMLFGALAGARRLILLDAHGALREERVAGVLLSSPFRLAREALASVAAVARARRELKRLERAVAGGALKTQRGAHATEASSRDEHLRFTFLRATPAAGTQVGGSTSHINGFLNAALELHARVSVISNDRIAGLDESSVELKVIEPEPLGLTRA
ncbi:MAG: hypothetical protein LC754_13805, partial [Acidobacteria bacterium]|nr:hypothetical protein [Acidobacteriota bacterium]